MRNQTSSSTTTTPTRRKSRRQRMLSPERLNDIAFIVMLTLLEVLPIEAALLVYAASATGSLATAFGPLWLIVATLLVFALARWRLGKYNPAWLTLAALVIGAVSVGLFVALSPTGYGVALGSLLSFDWLQQFLADAAHDTSHFNSLFAIVPFVVYLGWRGLALGAPPPRIEPTLRRYTISLAVVMLACVGAMAAPEVAQASLQSALLALLALDVFAGLAAAALARRGGGRESGQSEDAGAETTRWLLTAFGAAGLVIVVAFALGLALNLRLAHPLIVALGAIGDVLNVVLSWLTLAIAYALWYLFVNTIGALFFKNANFYLSQNPSPPNVPNHPTTHHVLAPPPPELVTTIAVLVALIVAALVIYALYLSIRTALRFMRSAAEPEVDEEREALDAGGLLRRQLSDLFAQLRRRPEENVDPLKQGSVRWLYREILRAGAAAGIARRESETADEYSERLARSVRERGEGELDLVEMTRAYDDARYGESAAGASPDVAAEANAASATLARLREGR